MRFCLGILLVAVAGCSSSSHPAAPGTAAAAATTDRPSITLSAAAREPVCSVLFTGRARSLCNRLYSLSCDATPQDPRCPDLEAQFTSLTGKTAPYYRQYVATDLASCAIIRWTCLEGYVAFTDASGCGCEPIVQP